jgi:hypothetical protein
MRVWAWEHVKIGPGGFPPGFFIARNAEPNRAAWLIILLKTLILKPILKFIGFDSNEFYDISDFIPM